MKHKDHPQDISNLDKQNTFKLKEAYKKTLDLLFCKWKFKKSIVLLLILIGLLVCFFSFFLLQRYNFESTQKSYSINPSKEYLQISPSLGLECSLKLIFSFIPDQKESLQYIQSLNNLNNLYENLCVIALSSEPMSKEDQNKFISEYKINFLLLAPKKNHPKFATLIYKNIQERIHKDIKNDVHSLPILFLYDKNNKLYEYYQGFVPQEMISFDIKKILLH